MTTPMTLGDWRIDPSSHSISGDQGRVRLSPKAMDVLMLLISHQGEVVSRTQILDEVWHGRVVVEESVTQAISELRKALTDQRRPPRYIETVPKAGYRLLIQEDQQQPVGYAEQSGPYCVAVLPFADLSETKNQEHLCEGMADELIDALFQVPDLKVISRAASFQFRRTEVDPVEIAKYLGVSHLVEGSVRRQGDALRIHVRLVAMPQGYPVWSNRIDRTVGDLFALQDEIAVSVVQGLKADVPAFRSRQQPDLVAYDFYLRGRQYFYRGGANAGRLGQQMFRRAIEVDPDYALAHAGLADMYAFAWLYYFYDQQLLRRARTAAERALQLAPDLAEAQSAMGSVCSAEKNHAEARNYFQKAIELNPNAFESNYLFGRASLVSGEYETAVRHFEQATRIRPETFQVYTLLGRAYRALGRTEAEKESYSEARKLVEAQLKLVPNDTRALCVAAACEAVLGSPQRARELAITANQTDDPMNFYAACALARAGFDKDALDALDLAVENGWNHLSWLDHDPELEGVRQSKRFAMLREKLAQRLEEFLRSN